MEQQLNYQGIDYGSGLANIDHETRIRYGVIPANDVGQAWFDESEAIFDGPYCPECGGDVIEYDDDDHKQYRIGAHSCQDFACNHCEYVFDSEIAYHEQPTCFQYERDGYICEQSGDDGDIFIIKSKYYTYAQFCSPCAPGAGHLCNPLHHKPPENKTYCFGHSWFEDEKAPYTVYSVKTNEIINQ